MASRPGHHDDEDDPSPATSTGTSPLAVIGLILAVVALGVGLFAPLHLDQSKKTPTVTVAEFQSLRDSLVSLQGQVAWLKAHTDTTGLADVRNELATLRHNDEQRSSDIQRMTEAFDRVYLTGKR